MALVSAKIPRRAVDPCRCFDDLHRCDGVGFVTTELTRTNEAEQARLAQGLDGGFIQAAEFFRLWRVLGEDWRHRFDFRQQLVSQQLVGLHATPLSSRSRIRNDPDQRPPFPDADRSVCERQGAGAITEGGMRRGVPLSPISRHHADVRQMAILLGVVGAVADDKHIADPEADKIDRNCDLSSLRFVEQCTGPETADPPPAQLGGGIGDRPAGIDDVVDQEHRPAGKAGRYVAEKLHRAAALLGATVAAQPDELDFGSGAGEVGDKHPCALEQANNDKICRKRAGDLGGERLDPGGNVRRAEQNAQPTPRRHRAGVVDGQ
jgi:hypothetical protein